MPSMRLKMRRSMRRTRSRAPSRSGTHRDWKPLTSLQAKLAKRDNGQRLSKSCNRSARICSSQIDKSLSERFLAVTLERESNGFSFAGTAGGQTISMGGHEVTVITAQSPLAGRLLGRKAGDSFKLPSSSLGQVLTVE
jgi:hypothetical protein